MAAFMVHLFACVYVRARERERERETETETETKTERDRQRETQTYTEIVMLCLKSLDTLSGRTAVKQENGQCHRNHGGDIRRFFIEEMYQKLCLKTAMPSRRCSSTEPSMLRMMKCGR